MKASALLIMFAAVIGQAPELREREGNVIVSKDVPAARLEVDASFAFVGQQSIRLGRSTRAEQYIFVEADSDKRIRRLYWIQFEGKTDRSARPYDYSSDQLVDAGGIPFRTNYRFYPPSGFAGPAGSDGDQARMLLEREGYSLGPDLGRLRLVWLLGEPPLDELMIIYVEDLEPHGLTVEALEADPARWEAFQGELLKRALGGLSVRRLD